MTGEVTAFGFLCLTVLFLILLTRPTNTSHSARISADHIKSALHHAANEADLDFVLETTPRENTSWRYWRHIVKKLIRIKATEPRVDENDLLVSFLLHEIDRLQRNQFWINIILAAAILINSLFFLLISNK